MSQLPVRAAGIPWYRQEDYPRICKIMADPHLLHDTFAEWEKAAKGVESRLKAQGHLVYRAVIDPDEFPSWCKARGLNVDAHGRTEFANAFAYEQVKRTH